VHHEAEADEQPVDDVGSSYQVQPGREDESLVVTAQRLLGELGVGHVVPRGHCGLGVALLL